MKRKIPFTTKLTLLFGGTVSQAGWFFFGFGLVFVWIFALESDFSSLKKDEELERAQGTVTSIRETGVTENGRLIMEVHFSVTNRERQTFFGYSYTTGALPEPGSTVTIEYPPGKIEEARILGMRRKMYNPLGFLVILFPIIGLLIIGYTMYNSLNALKILRDGELTTGQLIAKEPTSAFVNDQRVFKMIFRFTDLQGRERKITAKTHLAHRLEDEAQEKLLYLRESPSRAVLIDTLPGSPELDARGNVTAVSPVKASVYLILPAATIFGHGFYLLSRLAG